MPYEKTQWSDGATALSAANMNKIETALKTAFDGVEGLAPVILNLIYPVGSIFMTTSLDTAEKVSEAIGGTWEAWGAGRVPVGVGSADGKTFAINETGGHKDPVLPSHNHTFTGNLMGTHNHTQNNHDHGALSTNADPNQRFITVNSLDDFGNEDGTGISGSGKLYPRLSSDSSGFMRQSKTMTAKATNNAASAGTPSGTISYRGESDTTDRNLQPYVTCYMWRRIA